MKGIFKNLLAVNKFIYFIPNEKFPASTRIKIIFITKFSLIDAYRWQL